MIDEKLYQLSECGEYYSLKPEYAEGYRKACDDQLALWLKGTSVHNVYLSTLTGDPAMAECCPDFSCCGAPIWSPEMRLAFSEADTITRTRMCMDGLPSALGAIDPNLPIIHVAGDDTSETVH